MASEMKRAEVAAQARLASMPRALSVGLWNDGRLLIELSDGSGFLFQPGRVEGLENATRDDLAHVTISPSGYGLHFPTVDADVYLPGLLEGRFGSARFMAAAMGARGGKARTPAKAEASRQNGRLGGRPRKQVTA